MRYDKALGAFVELAASRHNAIHSDEAAEHHLTAERLRKAELQGITKRLHARVWALTAMPPSDMQALRGAVLSVDGSAATATSAAWLHGWIDAPNRPQLWVPSTRNGNHPLADLRRWKRIDPTLDITTVDHIATLNKATTLCSLGPHVDDLTLERCLDEFLHTESARWLDDTMERLNGHKPGGVGALDRVRNAPERVQGVADSWLERVVARLVARPGVPPLKLQHQVGVDGRNYRLDLACPELKLGIEAHSRTFHFGRQKEEADNVRDLALTSAGWQIIYVTYAQTKDEAAFVRLFTKPIATRASQLGIDVPQAS